MFVRANWCLCVGVVAGGYQDGDLLFAAAALAARRSTGGRRQAATAPTVGPADVRRLRAHVTTGGGIADSEKFMGAVQKFVAPRNGAAVRLTSTIECSRARFGTTHGTVGAEAANQGGKADRGAWPGVLSLDVAQAMLDLNWARKVQNRLHRWLMSLRTNEQRREQDHAISAIMERFEETIGQMTEGTSGYGSIFARTRAFRREVVTTTTMLARGYKAHAKVS